MKIPVILLISIQMDFVPSYKTFLSEVGKLKSEFSLKFKVSERSGEGISNSLDHLKTLCTGLGGANVGFLKELAYHYPLLDGFNQHFQATVHFSSKQRR